MMFPDSISRVSRRFSVRDSRGYARPHGMNGLCDRRFTRLRDTGASHNATLLQAAVPFSTPGAPDIRLTPRFKTLQSP